MTTHGKAHANEILDDIDRRIKIIPLFSGIRQFPQGRGFKQWTGDDSKALMKVYLAAIEGYVPPDMVHAFHSKRLAELEDVLARFHRYRVIFQECGVREEGFNLPHQHSLVHYFALIRAFGAPNSLYKLAASHADFMNHGMLKGTCLSLDKPNKLGEYLHYNAMFSLILTRLTCCEDVNDNNPGNLDEIVAGPRFIATIELAKTLHDYVFPNQLTMSISHDLAVEINQPDFLNLIRHFLYGQLRPDSSSDSGSLLSSDASLGDLPEFHGRVTVYNSAVAKFYAPSDLSGVGGITDSAAEGMRGLDVARARLFFKFKFHGVIYCCALIQWFLRIGNNLDEDTGMWMIKPDMDDSGLPIRSIIHLETISSPTPLPHAVAHITRIEADANVHHDVEEQLSLSELTSGTSSGSYSMGSA
ncbi:hypothetical protein BJV78DRAFT_1276756 [Lactifluus subvellereus]|nr:hypothetical protein BJV78DRAFT_1276756 [Lactifluus subvellereus]